MKNLENVKSSMNIALIINSTNICRVIYLYLDTLVFIELGIKGVAMAVIIAQGN